MTLPPGNHRITKAYFRICSTGKSHSEAGLCLCTRHAIANRVEPTFALLRYTLGGDRPSQTAHLTLSSTRLHGLELGSKQRKGGISTLAPRWPEPPDHRLPPILRMRCLRPISGYSKGSRGLSVLPRVCGIFTTNTISPSPSLRQCSSRYAIHARRNLPDKEFRSGCYSQSS